MKTILKNAVHCKLCNTTIESKHRHDFVICKCGNIGVDGGKEYFRRIGKGIRIPDSYEDLSIESEVNV